MPLKSLLFRGRVTLLFASFVISLLLALQAPAQMRQVFLDDLKPDNEIKAIDFYSASSGYVAFRDWIGHTVDTGRTFSRKYITIGNVDYAGNLVNLTFGFSINGVKSISQNDLLVYGDYGFENTILRSTDGGSTFRVVFYKPLNETVQSEGITDVSFTPGSTTTGYAVDEYLILKTTNGGQSWSVVKNQRGDNLSDVQAIDNNTAIAFSGPKIISNRTNKLYRTVNAGGSWQQVTLPDGTLYGAYFLSANTGWISLSSGFYQTLNGGVTWTRQDTPLTPFSGQQLYFADDQTGYALSDFHTVYKTTNGGKYWEAIANQQEVAPLVNFERLHAYNSTQVWAGGEHGLLHLTTNGGGTLVPKAYFSIDTTGYYPSGTVKLVNHSKSTYSFKWFKNGQLVGTTYNSTFTGSGYPHRDTLKLVVSNGVYTDTAVAFHYYEEPATISSFTPTIARSGATVTITGAQLANATAVYFGGVPAASFKVIDNYTISAIVAAGASGKIEVITPNRGIATKAGFTFWPPPTITSLSPTSSTAGGTITITGTNFADVKSVKIGGLPAISFTVVSPTTITAVVPSGPSGNIEVVTGAGQYQITGYTAIPFIKVFSPLAATNSSLLKISGSSLLEVTSVSVGGVPVKSFTIHHADSITAVIGEGATGSVAINSPGGTSSKPGFTYILPPVVTSMAPLTGKAGTTVTITGTNFNPAPANNIVMFGTLKATVLSASPTTLTVSVPAGATKNPVSVTNNTLTAYSAIEFQTFSTSGGPITPSSFRKMVFPGPEAFSRMHREKAVADLDGDGKQDLVLMSAIMASYWTVYRNTSSGNTVSFEEVTFPFIATDAIAITDVDGDGKPDVVMKNYQGKIVIHRNLSTPGNLQFADGVEFYANAPSYFVNLCVNDLDKDGKPDIAIAGPDMITLLRNTGEPGLLSFEPTYLTHPGDDMLVYDINQDGKPDIVQIDKDGNNIAIHPNISTKGSFSFGSPSIVGAQSPTAIDIADLDHDGKPDIATISSAGNMAQVFRNMGTAGSISLAGAVNFSFTSSPQDLALTDLDGDGKLEITATLTNHHFGSLKNTSTTGNIHFEEGVNHYPGTYSTWRQPFTLTVGDFNADSKPDLVVLDPTLYKANVYINESSAKPFIREWDPAIGNKDLVITIKGLLFTGTTAVSFGGVPAASFTVVNDSTLQAVVGAGATGEVAVTNSFGTSTKSGFVYGAIPMITSFTPTSGPVGTKVVITGKGFDPVAGNNTVYFGGVNVPVIASTGTTLTVLAPGGMSTAGITVTTNSLTATASRQFYVTYASNPAGFTKSSFAESVNHLAYGLSAVADFDKDGKNDFVHASGEPEALLYRNTSNRGTASFSSPIKLLMAGGVSAAAAGDLDGDGYLDIVTVNATNATFMVFRNTTSNGVLSFEPGATFKLIEDPLPGNSVAIGDLDGDGRPEVVTTAPDAIRFTVHKNLSVPGKISFDAYKEYGLIGRAKKVMLHDLNNDGKLETLVGTFGYGNRSSVLVFQNKGQAGVIDLVMVPGMGGYAEILESMSLSDIDGDGRTDIAIGGASMGVINVAQNVSQPASIGFKDAMQLIQPFGGGNYTGGIADLDGDGKPELLATVGIGIGSFIHKNVSAPGTISYMPKADIGGSMAIPQFVDIDGDGALDVINAYGQVFLNNMMGAGQVEICATTDTTLSSGFLSNSYQWQEDRGAGYVNVQDNTNISGAKQQQLKLTAIPQSWNGHTFRCLDESGQPGTAFKLQVNTGNEPTSVTIVSSRDSACSGQAITFIATPVNGGNSPSYQWMVNSTNVGEGGNTFGSASLQDGAEVKVTMTSNNTCASNPIATSNTIKMGVKERLTSTVTIKAVSSTECSSLPLMFEATPSNGGISPQYLWLKNGNYTGDGEDNRFNFTSLQNGDQVEVKMSVAGESGVCYGGNHIGSNVITIGGNNPLDPKISTSPSVTISIPSTNICVGDNLTFTAYPVNGGTSPTYQWQVNGVNAGNNTATFTSDQLKPGDAIKAILTGNAPCAIATPAISNTITLTGSTPVTPAVSITASATSICAGKAVTFTATPVNEGSAPRFEWYINGASIGANSSTLTYTGLKDNDKVTVVLTSSVGCKTAATATSEPITITVSPMAKPQITITASATDICPDTKVYFTATTVHGGPTPQILWSDGTRGPEMSSSYLKDGDEVYAHLTTSLTTCVADTDMGVMSNKIRMRVTNSVVPAVTIVASKNDICTGTNVTFTATPTNGGSAPAYQWQVNGANAGTNAAGFSSASLSNGAIVKVLLTSSLACASKDPVSSNAVTMIVSASVTPSVTISGNTTLDENSSSLISATVTNGGSTPAWYWQDSTGAHGWQDVPGASGASVNYKPLETGDKLRVRVVSNASCLVRNTAISTPLTFIVNVPNGGKIAPNPVQNMLNIGELSLDDQWETAEIAGTGSGNRVEVIRISGRTSLSVSVAHLPKGVYVVLLRSKTGTTKRIKFIKQ